MVAKMAKQRGCTRPSRTHDGTQAKAKVLCMRAVSQADETAKRGEKRLSHVSWTIRTPVSSMCDAVATARLVNATPSQRTPRPLLSALVKPEKMTFCKPLNSTSSVALSGYAMDPF